MGAKRRESRSPFRHRRERVEWDVSPIRGSGAPHHRKPFEPSGNARKLGGGWGTNRGPKAGGWARDDVEAMDVLQVAESQRQRKMPRGRDPTGNPRFQLPMEEDESIEQFFGQLWVIPQLRSARVSQAPTNLFWIRKDLWDSRSFQTNDCYPVQEGVSSAQIGRRGHSPRISGPKVSSEPSQGGQGRDGRSRW
jgi:hypothetical protein